MTTEYRSKSILVTDLDHSDTQEPRRTTTHQHKRRQALKTLQTASGNFNRRSHSAECNITETNEKRCNDTKNCNLSSNNNNRIGKTTPPLPKNTKLHNYFNELLQTKDRQMENLLERLATLHKFNEQFAEENKKLHEDVDTLEDNIVSLRKQIANCDQCCQLSQKLTETVKMNKTLTENIDMLKTLVYRLNVQIEHYQDQLRKAKTDPVAPDDVEQSELPNSSNCFRKQNNWLESVHMHALAPLLRAYDEMINDKDDLIKQYTQEFDCFTGKLKDVIEENTHLHKEYDTLKRDVSNWREERTRLQAQLDICRTKAETQTQRTDLAKEKLVEVMRCYEQKMQSLVLDLDHLQMAYGRCKAELTQLKSVATQPQSTITSSLQECKDLLEQLKQQHSKEKEQLETKIKELTERHENSVSILAEFRQDNNVLKKKCAHQEQKLIEVKTSNTTLKKSEEKMKRARDHLKARLRIALQWAQKLEESRSKVKTTWDAIKRLETIVQHKESQIRGLQTRHFDEVSKLEAKLAQKDETIKKILTNRITTPSKIKVTEET